MGISLGGCLAIRAAAYEPRIARAAAFDVLTQLAPMPVAANLRLRRLLLRGLQGMSRRNHRCGCEARGTPASHRGMGNGPGDAYFLRKNAACRARSSRTIPHPRHIGRSYTQDVLLCAGAEDHYVPLHQLYDQARWLTGARSTPARVFTRAECAQNHCQIGNLPLAMHTVGAWIEAMAGYHLKVEPEVR